MFIALHSIFVENWFWNTFENLKIHKCLNVLILSRPNWGEKSSWKCAGLHFRPSQVYFQPQQNEIGWKNSCSVNFGFWMQWKDFNWVKTINLIEKMARGLAMISFRIYLMRKSTPRDPFLGKVTVTLPPMALSK